MNISESLIAARALLTPEVWHKGSYFAAKGDTVCMCAHGATQAIINNSVIAALAAAASPRCSRAAAAPATAARAASAMTAAATAAAITAAAAAAATAAAIAAVAVKSTIPHTPLWAEGLEAHSYMGHVGLTVAFNDSGKTTLPDVLAKFDEAIALALSNGQ